MHATYEYIYAAWNKCATHYVFAIFIMHRGEGVVERWVGKGEFPHLYNKSNIDGNNRRNENNPLNSMYMNGQLPCPPCTAHALTGGVFSRFVPSIGSCSQFCLILHFHRVAVPFPASFASPWRNSFVQIHREQLCSRRNLWPPLTNDPNSMWTHLYTSATWQFHFRAIYNIRDQSLGVLVLSWVYVCAFELPKHTHRVLSLRAVTVCTWAEGTIH